MTVQNIIVLVGNGFDLAHGFKTKFSDFADDYIDNRIIPELEDVIINRNGSNNFFKKNFVSSMVKKNSSYSYENIEDALWIYINNKKHEELKDYLNKDFKVLKLILQNSFLGKLYSDTDKNWFDIENTYFKELIKIKDIALKNTSTFDSRQLQILNKEFYEIKIEVLNYLKTIKTETDGYILQFFVHHFRNVKNVYFVNFNYTNTLKLYTDLVQFQGNMTLNHIHGDLESGNIVFGYGNDQNDDYQEIKNLEIDEFLRYFKTFDYLNNINYDNVNDKAIDKFPSYDVYILGHSLGLTDKTLLSEILNKDKCRSIHFFKRSDLKEDPSIVKSIYRELTYSASRILTNERELRKKIVNFESSISFP